MLKLIALCHYHLYVAFYTLDHADLLLDQSEANDPLNVFCDFLDIVFTFEVDEPINGNPPTH